VQDKGNFIGISARPLKSLNYSVAQNVRLFCLTDDIFK